MGCGRQHFSVPYEFREWEEELEPQASGQRVGGPPRKPNGIGVLDPPRPPGPLAPLSASFLGQVLAGLILAGLVLFVLFALFGR
jgi:hypothetical protein